MMMRRTGDKDVKGFRGKLLEVWEYIRLMLKKKFQRFIIKQNLFQSLQGKDAAM